MHKFLTLVVFLVCLLLSTVEAQIPQYGGRLKWDAGSVQSRKSLRMRFQFELLEGVWYATNLGAELRLKFKLKGAAIKRGRVRVRRAINGSSCLVVYEAIFKPSPTWSFVRTAFSYGFECANGVEGWEGFAGKLPKL